MKHKTKYKHIYSDSLKNGLDIEIDSKYEEGTKVTLHLPKNSTEFVENQTSLK